MGLTRSLRELPANWQLRCCVGRTGSSSATTLGEQNTKGPARGHIFVLLAERVGFEPTVRITVLLISNKARSTTPAPLPNSVFLCLSDQTSIHRCRLRTLDFTRHIHVPRPAGVASRRANRLSCRFVESSPFDHSGTSPKSSVAILSRQDLLRLLYMFILSRPRRSTGSRRHLTSP